ncbi:TPA: IS30 family transposase, partial [Streptococcus pyogenes]|nr:IS30 family transposase [Streptococcus pyogenes]
LIRRCLPKGTKTTTPKEVAAIEHWINHYPKRLFNYKSPVEMLKLANFNLKFGLCLLVSVKTSFCSFWVTLAKSFYLRYSELD